MAIYEAHISGDPMTVLTRMNKYILESASNLEPVEQTVYSEGAFSCHVLVYSKYSGRNSSRASLTLTVVGTPDALLVSAISAGGGHGALFNLSWGVEEELTALAHDALAQQGYKL